MQVVKVSDVEASVFANHRGDGIAFRRLIRGDEGSPHKFELYFVHIDERNRTPRHHHNFDQIHYVLEGEHQYLRQATMPAGTVTYFPEGTHYGPQVGQGATVLGLQMGGSSGAGFMSYDQLAHGNRALAERGRFENGIYRFTDESGRTHNQDGYEAIWEHVHDTPLRYPRPRYDHPLTMWPEHFDWVPSATEEAVAHKHLATFGERRTSVAFLRIGAGATHRLPDENRQRLHFVLKGRGRCGEHSFDRHTAIRIDAGERAAYTADTETEIFLIGLPTFSATGS
jgi:mannose-6-phosphate isomerase-like protein (cupin superfamily)